MAMSTYPSSVEVPAFQAMPSSVSRIATGVVHLVDTNNELMQTKSSAAAAAYQPLQYSKTVKREVILERN